MIAIFDNKGAKMSETELPFMYLHPSPAKRKKFYQLSEKFKQTKNTILAVFGGPEGVLNMLAISNPSKSKDKTKRNKAALALIERTLLGKYLDDLEAKLIILTRRSLMEPDKKKAKAFHQSVRNWLKKNEAVVK